MAIRFVDKKTFIVQVKRGRLRRTKRGAGTLTEAKRVERELVAVLEHELKLDDAARLLGVERPDDPKARKARKVPTVREYFEARWLEHSKVVHNATTRLKSQFAFQYLLYHIGDQRLDELLEPSAINAFIEAMKKRGPISFAQRKGGGPRRLASQELSNSAVNKCLQLLRSMLYLAFSEKVVLSPPRIQLLPQDDSEAIVSISEEQFQLLLKSCEDFREVAPLLPEIAQFTAETGLRRGEVFNLTFRSVDFSRACIRVETQRRVRTVNGRAWKPKNKKWREIPLSTRARAIVDARREAGPCGPDDLVFPNEGGAPYLRMDFAPECAGKGFFPDAVAAAGLKGRVTFHGLRHLFAVRLLTRGVPIAVVSELLGHSDINLTVKRYGRFASDARVKWDAMKVLDQDQPDQTPPERPRLELVRDATKVWLKK